MKFNWLHSLRFRLTVGTVLILLLMFGLLSFNASRLLHSFAEESIRANITQTSETLNLALAPLTTAEGLISI